MSLHCPSTGHSPEPRRHLLPLVLSAAAPGSWPTPPAGGQGRGRPGAHLPAAQGGPSGGRRGGRRQRRRAWFRGGQRGRGDGAAVARGGEGEMAEAEIPMFLGLRSEAQCSALRAVPCSHSSSYRYLAWGSAQCRTYSVMCRAYSRPFPNFDCRAMTSCCRFAAASWRRGLGVRPRRQWRQRERGERQEVLVLLQALTHRPTHPTRAWPW